jgi:hypothetical protein
LVAPLLSAVGTAIGRRGAAASAHRSDASEDTRAATRSCTIRCRLCAWCGIRLLPGCALSTVTEVMFGHRQSQPSRRTPPLNVTKGEV